MCYSQLEKLDNELVLQSKKCIATEAFFFGIKKKNVRISQTLSLVYFNTLT